MNELPPDFPHDAPTGYRYETIPFTTTVDAIWTISNRRFNYNDGDESRTIWGLKPEVHRVEFKDDSRPALLFHGDTKKLKRYIQDNRDCIDSVYQLEWRSIRF